ncbi:MAG: ribosome maturation factor RimP [Desulfovibrionaceae bacterium]|nr:ribosome maturation factor RimP [Desulfovibrionaceae bacterium]
MNECLEKVRAVAEPIVRSLGLTLWGLEIVGSGKPCLRVYIDVADVADSAESAGAALDQCEAIAKDLGLALDVENIFPGAWVLEVSSPGLSRTFFTLDQMRAYVGQVVDVRLLAPLSFADEGAKATDRKQWTGILTHVYETAFTLKTVRIFEDDTFETLPEEVRLEWSNVRFARRHALFPKPPKPGKKAGKK